MSARARRWVSNGLALCLLLVAAALVAYGILFLVAIPRSDTATSVLVLSGLLLLAAGTVSAFLAVFFRRLGRLRGRVSAR
jgi:hypothetical protein